MTERSVGVPPVKVSVVIATYNSGERLRATLDSVLRQSLPPEAVEILVVDDGSTDGTAEAARGLLAGRPTSWVTRIDNSGWPGRPRNIGTARATGSYVLYLDHDDELFPESLERQYDYAVACGADVLLGKEVMLGGPTVGWSTWKANIARVERIDQRVLQCMTPHKLYRREFLIEQQISFPEGKVRLEDYDFNAQAYVRAGTVSVLADYPCYRWQLHGTNLHRKGVDQDVYWRSFDRSLLPVERELPPGPEQDEYLLRWYSSRVLGRMGVTYARYKPPARDLYFARCRAALEHFPERIDTRLNPFDRLRSALLRRADQAGLLALAEADRGRRLAIGPARWSRRRGVLSVAAHGVVVDADGTALALEEREGRLFRRCPAGLEGRFTDRELDVTTALDQAGAELSVRARGSGVEWALPSTGTVRVVGPGEDRSLRVEVTGVVDPRTAAFGSPLDDDIWDVWVHAVVLGLALRGRVRSDAPARVARLARVGRHVAYTTKDGYLAVDVGGRQHPHAASRRPAAVRLAARLARRAVRRLRRLRRLAS